MSQFAKYRCIHRMPVAIAAVALALTGTAASAQSPQPAQSAQPAAMQGPVGLWFDHTGRGVVEIAPCGADLCGRIVWLKDVNDTNGKLLRDSLNGDAKKRNRPICGLQVIGGLKKQNDGSYDNGWIYDPEKGEAFDVELRSRGADGLQVKGYKGVKFLSETFQWKRAGALPTARCAT